MFNVFIPSANSSLCTQQESWDIIRELGWFIRSFSTLILPTGLLMWTEASELQLTTARSIHFSASGKVIIVSSLKGYSTGQQLT